MITKQQAAILWAYDYKLVDKEGNVYDILNPVEKAFGIRKQGVKKLVSVCYYDWIGADYFILARPLESLTKEIEHEGKIFVPVVVLGFPNTTEVFESFIHVIDYNYIPSSEKEKLYSWNFNIGFPKETVKPLTP